MPWELRKKGDQTCVHKKGESKPVPGGCHDSRADAVKHQRALYAAERRKGGGMSAVETVEQEAETTVRWEGPLGLEGFATSDGRYLIPGEISERALPLPLNVQLLTDEGHKSSANAGRIDAVTRFPVGEFDRRDEFHMTDVPDDATVIWGEGVFDDSDAAREAMRMLGNGAGISLDLPHDRFGLFDKETLEEVSEDDVQIEDVLAGKYLHGYGGKIAGATVVTVPAFEHAVIQVADGHALVASAFGLRFEMDGLSVTPATVDLKKAVEGLSLLAAAAIRRPPREWLDDPHLPGPTPLTYTDDGRIYGHLAPWNGCHTGYGGVCIPPPRSSRDYALFNVGLVECDNGDEVACGKLMFCRDGGKHAPLHLRGSEVSKHYDDATKVAGYVRAGADRHGIWLAGFLSDDLTDDDRAFLKANPPSGDWRSVTGDPYDKELVAAFCVPVPGFPIPHALVASAGEEVTSIILGPWAPETVQPREFRRRIKTLSARVGLDGFRDGFRDVSTDERKRLAKRGGAMPDGSFPIATCTDAQNAIRSIGRAPEERRDAVRRHIRRRVRSLGCTNVGDEWR